MAFELVTIGVYGSSEVDFFATLVKEKVDTFCDIRLRRGMRGAKYAFANSTRLQNKLQDLGIRYVHSKELAPTPAVRDKQKQIDKTQKVAKRDRETLSVSFIQDYEHIVLTQLDMALFVKSLGEAHRVALFCVERQPEACHRSLVAKKIATELGITVTHLLP